MENNLDLLLQAKKGDDSAKEKLVEQNLGLVWSVARRFTGRGYDIEDLFQIGCIGLIKSIDKFDFEVFDLCSSADPGGNPPLFAGLRRNQGQP